MNTDDERLWSVYRHTDPNGKVYIGVTKDIKHRWRGKGNGYKGGTGIWNAIQTYGWDGLLHEIIASNLTQDEAWDMETELIDSYNATDPDHGYNLTFGGQHNILSQISRERLSKSLMGHPISDRVRQIFDERRGTPIICLDTMETFKDAQDASNKLGLCRTSILKAANGKQATCGGYRFTTLDDYKNDKIKQFIPSPHNYNKVRCVTTGEEFDNVSDASRKTGLSRRAISYACNGVHETCGKMKWEFISEKKEEN